MMDEPSKDSPEWEEFRSCTRKYRYQEPPTNYAGWTRPYRCIFCDGWHLTSKPRTGKQKNSKETAVDLLIKRLLDFSQRDVLSVVNMRECAAIELHRLKQENEKYRKALEIISGSPDGLMALQAKAALPNIGPPCS